MAELLLEILSEEIPARMQARAADDLKRLMCDGLKVAGLDFDNARSFVTPRRLVFVADGIPESTPDISEERKGPATDAPEQALHGFLGSVGLTLDQCEKREVKGREFYFAVIEKKGNRARDVLFDTPFRILQAMPWPKSMQWGDRIPEFGGQIRRWVRPIHSMVFIFNGETIHGGLLPHGFGATKLVGPKEGFGSGVIPVGGETVGHRFLAPGPITVTDFTDYECKLRNAKVMVDPAERRDLIATRSAELAASEGLTVKDDPALLNEVAGLVEWPVPLIGKIDDQFMDLPAEVLVTSMRSHQKYFSCLDKDGNFANRFILVANTETKDSGAQVIAGNERVLSARLADARFFWDADRAQTLASRAPALKDRVFHAKLGNLGQKTERVEALAVDLAASVPGADSDMVCAAARLAKVDLSTGMVAEFPELQGIMGRYYALNDGESEDVADAIAEHYAPQGPGDTCPTKPISVCVSLADKIDTMVGFFGIDEKPTGSKDPFALRRAALGVIRLIIENDLRVPLASVFAAGSGHYAGQDDFDCNPDDLLDFFADRLKVHLRDQGVRHDLVDAVFAVEKRGGGREDDLVRLLARVDALKEFLDTEDGANLLTAYKRAANILRIEEKKDDCVYDQNVDGARLEQDEESALLNHLVGIEADILTALTDERFADAMSALATARPLVDAFFDNVTVNCDDAGLRVNRLNLLALVRNAMDLVADFSRIEG